MDLLAVRVKDPTISSILPRSSTSNKIFSPRKPWINGGSDIRVFRRRLVAASVARSSVVKATSSKKDNDDFSSPSSGNGGQHFPEGDAFKGNNLSKGNESTNSGTQKPHPLSTDWREFRANLFRQEKAEKAESDAHEQGASAQEFKALGLKWAHPIPVPETGCVLVATEKLDGVRTFERTVVLLLRSGTRHPQEGPFGIVINRPLHKTIKHMKPTNNELGTTFADCALYYGGPLDASIFLMRTGEKPDAPGFEKVISGLSFGARNTLEDAAALIKRGMLKPEDFRFFVGYAGWQYDQLREEVEANFWHVAACSSNLIYGASCKSSEHVWEEILQLMGGHYSELSRKPRQDI